MKIITTKRVTPERAQSLLGMVQWGDVPTSYLRKCDVPTKTLNPNGLTEAEDAYVKLVWDSMPGHTCFLDALQRIAKGKV